MSRYMIVLVCAGIVPLAMSFYPSLRFYRSARALAASLGTVIIVFAAWDIVAVARGHWRFDQNGISGLRMLSLPAEEWLFFLVIPFCCIFSWEVMRYFADKKK